ncbi:hypothetical protein [Pseudoxanthomonas wuyuanensis]|uniref:hypothetical protein n=1 Tax=Pseudoxanthomonas wuyuanensis TaxID=1073196 RepID=UPI00114439A7|nr:hypothetical protein [Pseudoxanthomonas wuyuanensis]
MHSFESMEDACRVARQVLAGEVDPNLGCGLIAAIGEKLGFPDSLDTFLLLGHEQYDHEGLGITAKSCVPDILEACRVLLAPQA